MVAEAQLTAVLQGKTISGLTPVLDRRQVEQQHTIDGRNFLFNAQGPYSGYARRLTSKNVIPSAANVMEFECLDGRAYVFTDSTIYWYDTDGDIFSPVYSFDHVDTPYPWSHALVGAKDYFCKDGLGVLKYDPNDRSWELLDSNPYMPAGPVSICEVRGRLFVLGTGAYAWSALDDGENLEPSLITGAGTQSIALIGGTPLACMGLPDAGLIFTSKGIIVAEFSGGQAVFRHRVLTRMHAAVGPQVIALLDNDTVIFLDQKGFHACNGKFPEIWQPAFSEFVSTKIIPTKLTSDLDAFRLHICHCRKWVVFGISNGSSDVYGTSYVLYYPIDKWGIFNDAMYGIINVHVDISDEVYERRLSVVNPDGYVHRFTDENFIEGVPDIAETQLHQAEFEMQSIMIDGIVYFRDVLFIDSYALNFYGNLPTGFYKIQGDTESFIAPDVDYDMPAVLEVGVYYFRDMINFGVSGGEPEVVMEDTIYNPLDAYVSVGMMRFNKLRYDDELGQVLHMTIWNDAVGVDVDSEDYNTTPDLTEDYNILEGMEDWGVGIIAGDDFKTSLYGTNDGTTVFNQQLDLVASNAVGEHLTRYPCDVVGQFHYVTVEATDYPETFHLKSVELTGTSAGRLF